MYAEHRACLRFYLRHGYYLASRWAGRQASHSFLSFDGSVEKLFAVTSADTRLSASLREEAEGS